MPKRTDSFKTDSRDASEKSLNYLRYRFLDPVGFIDKNLGCKLWPKQAQIAYSLAENRRVAVKACHSSGKTRVAAALALWWLIRWPHGATVVSTASTWNQVRNVLWREIHRLIGQSILDWPVPNQTEVRLPNGNFAVGLSTKEETRLQGFHDEHLLVILDEAPGVEAKIWDAAMSLLASGDSKLLAVGNPTSAVGPFYDAFSAKREGWKTWTISAFEMPTMAGLTVLSEICAHGNKRSCNLCKRDPDRWSFLCTPEWIREQYRDWGTEHPFWISRVLGDFVSEDRTVMFPLSLLERSKESCENDRDESERHDHSHDELIAGVDVAGGGADDTVVQIMSGWCKIAAEHFPEKDPRGSVVEFLGQYRERLSNVRVDVTGVGYNFAHHLADQGFPIEFVYLGGASTEPERFLNRRAEMYERASKALRDGYMSGLDGEHTYDRTMGELAAIKAQFTPRGQRKIEPKEDVKKRLGHSPDWADAFVLAGSEATTAEELVLVGRAFGMETTPSVAAGSEHSTLSDALPHVIQRRFAPTKETAGGTLLDDYKRAMDRYTTPSDSDSPWPFPGHKPK